MLKKTLPGMKGWQETGKENGKKVNYKDRERRKRRRRKKHHPKGTKDPIRVDPIAGRQIFSGKAGISSTGDVGGATSCQAKKAWWKTPHAVRVRRAECYHYVSPVTIKPPRQSEERGVWQRGTASASTIRGYMGRFLSAETAGTICVFFFYLFHRLV